MVVANDYYAILGVAPDADGAKIRNAYRLLMRRYHPDVNASAEAMALATAINEAYACLRDASKRAHYDRLRRRRPDPRRTARPAPPPTAPWQPGHVSTAGVERQPFRFEPSWSKAAIVAIAALVTIVTFALTSATPPRDPVAPWPARAEMVGHEALPEMSGGTGPGDQATRAPK
ncbi:J domain-containing protein [Sphingomonas ginkgonis]|uniref:J domain-containing protein n=1 Tax=Sphingomonas ginkgonis TaxID=2315330 RepID=A0A3R9YKL4_9SPHN|nr:J domain-containing protein [Sphingomonas ginkgonis]RST31976.1 J domain-containing protein [Sphingomonas ginkgonis]